MPRPFVVVLVATAVAGLACGGSSSSGDGITERLIQEGVEKAIEHDNPGTDVELGSDGMSVTGKDGTAMQIGGNVSLPADFPKDVPIYGGAKLMMAVAQPSSIGGNDFVVSFETPDDAKKVMDWYKGQLSGYAVSAEMNYGGTMSLVLTNDGGKRNVTISASPGSSGDSSSGSTVILGVTHGN